MNTQGATNDGMQYKTMKKNQRMYLPKLVNGPAIFNTAYGNLLSVVTIHARDYKF